MKPERIVFESIDGNVGFFGIQEAELKDDGRVEFEIDDDTAYVKYEVTVRQVSRTPHPDAEDDE